MVSVVDFPPARCPSREGPWGQAHGGLGRGLAGEPLPWGGLRLAGRRRPEARLARRLDFKDLSLLFFFSFWLWFSCFVLLFCFLFLCCSVEGKLSVLADRWTDRDPVRTVRFGEQSVRWGALGPWVPSLLPGEQPPRHRPAQRPAQGPFSFFLPSCF